jgi:integrase/recombinase XerD
MDNFEQYLQAKKLSSSTIVSHCNNVNLFTQWPVSEIHLDAANIGYNDLLAYIQYEKQKNITPATINLRLASISHYFDYLKKLDEVKKNPARMLRVKGTVKRVVENPLSTDELQALYQHYSQLKKVSQHQQNTDLAHQRNTVILGLLVYQGVHSRELQKMEVGHISLGQEQYISHPPAGVIIEPCHYSLVRFCPSMSTCKKPGHSSSQKGMNFFLVDWITSFMHWC